MESYLSRIKMSPEDKTGGTMTMNLTYRQNATVQIYYIITRSCVASSLVSSSSSSLAVEEKLKKHCSFQYMQLPTIQCMLFVLVHFSILL